MARVMPPGKLMLGKKNTTFIDDYMITPIRFEDGGFGIVVQPTKARRFLLPMTRQELAHFAEDALNFVHSHNG